MHVMPRWRSLGERIHWRMFRNDSKEVNCSFKYRCHIEEEVSMRMRICRNALLMSLLNFLLLLLYCQHLWMVKVATERKKVMLSYQDITSYKDRQLHVSPRDTIISINIYLYNEGFFLFLQRTRSTSLVYQREFHFLIDFKQWSPWNIQSIHISGKNKGSIWKED